MSRAARSERALFLAAVAFLGLVATPLLHAEEHLLEEEHEREEGSAAAALALAWRAGSSDPLEALAAALAQGHGGHEGRGHRHSHGPAPAGEHGAGVLAHLAVALHAAPPLPELWRAPSGHTAPLATIAQLRGTLSYLIPRGSQGPPSRC